MRKVRFLLPLILLMLVGCAYNASLVNTTHDTLTVSAQSYDTGMKAATHLYRTGNITKEQRDEIIEAGTPFAQVQNELVETLARYEETKDDAEIDRIEALVERVSEALGRILSTLSKYLVKE
jgi:hypothetical protein